MTQVVGVRFKDTGKVYFFDPNGLEIQAGSHVIVETARGVECGIIAEANKSVEDDEVVAPLKPVKRIATQEDMKILESNKKKEKEAYNICLKKIEDHKLEMDLTEVEYTFDGSKIIFYFTADGRVDFRELVKDLASAFHSRIELRQIGVRDESKMIGGLGICGR
ncbi:MAG: stage 0 sporulation protein, partial [Eubacterium sp.]|nr:stage 0 sporulation protein [Eubacterium sp.]